MSDKDNKAPALAQPGSLPRAEAWLVIGSNGTRSVHLDHTLADCYAAKSHGLVHPLFLLGSVQPTPKDEVCHVVA